MIKINVLKDHSAPAEKKQLGTSAKKIPWIVVVYIVAIAALAAFGYLNWNNSGKALEKARTENMTLESQLSTMESLSRQFVELEEKKQERQSRINTINRLLDSQKGPVKLLNAVIQAIPQNREIWLTAMEQTVTGVKVTGETKTPEILPDFMENLEKSGIFASVDIEQIQRREDISNFSILCVGK